MKLLRNHILTEGISVLSAEKKYKVLSKNDFQSLLRNDAKDLRLCCKITPEHIDVRGLKKQNVRKAAELLSETVSRAFEHKFGNSYKTQSEAICIIYQWFDTCNSRLVTDFIKPHKTAFGLCEERQLQALSDMEVMVSTMRFANNQTCKTKKPFQKGILAGISSLKTLYNELKAEGVKYLLTSRLNQDCLESFFSRVRSIGGDNTHPNCVEFMNRVRTITLSGEPELIGEANWNTVDNDGSFLSVELSQHLQDEVASTTSTSTTISTTASTVDDELEGDVTEDENTKDILQYIGGYIARKIGNEELFREKNDDDAKSWISCRSNGNLIFPSDDLMKVIYKCEVFFNHFHGSSIKSTESTDNLVINIIKDYPNFDRKIIELFCKIRLHCRIRFLNQKLRDKKRRRGTRHYKQIGQFLE